MPASWKKVIVSGSSANLSNIQVDALSSGVVTGSSGNLGTVAINGTGQIVASTNATNLSASGSFSGSFTGALTGTATTASYVTGSVFTSTNPALSASYAVTASYLLGGGATPNSLTSGEGISTFSFNGNVAQTVAISGAADLANNTIVKWNDTDGKFANSTITDDGNLVTISKALKVDGDFTVAGTASFTNAENLLIRDQFIALNSGSANLQDAGFVVVGGTNMSGSAFYLESSVGSFGRFAVVQNLHPSASAATPNEYMVTALVNQGSAPTSQTPTWGGNGTEGQGNMWITTAGDIYIWA